MAPRSMTLYTDKQQQLLLRKRFLNVYEIVCFCFIIEVNCHIFSAMNADIIY